MAQISVPIQVNLPDNCIELVIERLKQDETVKPVVHGRWDGETLDDFRKYKVTCSECGAEYIGNYDAYNEPWEFNFCPNCGAMMDLEDE